MQLQPAHVTDFRGGLNTGAPLVGFPANQFPFAVNADALVNGRLRRRNGTRRTHASRITDGATEFTQSIGATNWWPTDEQQRVVFFQNSVYSSDNDGQTWDTVTTALGQASSNWHFATVDLGSDRWLYAASGGTNTFRWDGTSTFETAPGIPNNVRYMAVFNDRLYVAGHDGGNVQASAIGDEEDFTVPNGLVLPVKRDTGAGDIRGLYQAGPILLVFTRDATAYISGFGQSDLIVASGATGVSKSVGCLAVSTVQSIGGNAAIWLSPRGFELFAGGTIKPISSPQLDEVLDDEALQVIEDFSNGGDRPEPANAIFLPRRQQYWCSIQNRANDSTLFKYDLRTKAWTIHRYGMRDETVGTSTVFRLPLGKLVASPAGSFVVGVGSTDQDSQAQAMRPEAFARDGFWRELDWGDTDDADSDLSNGLDIEMEGRLRPFIWRDLPHRKRARQIRVNAETFQTDAVVRVSAVVDGKEQAGPDVLTNGNFESGALAPWFTTAGGGSWSVVPTNPRSGTFALQYDSTGQSAIASAHTTAPGPSGPGAPDTADPGDTWEFLIWVRAEAGMFARVGVIYRDVGQGVVGSKFTPFDVVEADGGYVPLRIAATAPTGTVEVQGRIETLLAISAGPRIWFGDARLRKLKRKALRIPSTEDDIPRQPLKARVDGRGRVQQVAVYTTDRVELVAVEERAEILREP